MTEEKNETKKRPEDAAAEEMATAGKNPLARPEDLWQGGVQLEKLLDDEGAIDPKKVEAAQEKVPAEHPDWRGQPVAKSFDGGARESARIGGPDFGRALKEAAGGSSRPLGQL